MDTVHSLLTDYLREHLPADYKVVWTLPESVNSNSKLDKLIVVEQTGGSIDDYEAQAVFALDVYADKLKTAEQTAYHVAQLLRQSVDDILPFLSVYVMSVFNNPLLDSHQPRYTLTFTLDVDWAYSAN